MKSLNNHLRWSIPAGLVLVLFIGLVAWTDRPAPPAPTGNPASDTIPKKKNNQRETDTRDLDRELRKLDEAQSKLNDLKEKDWSNINKQVEEAMQKVDAGKIRLQVEASLRQVDMEKIQHEVTKAMQKIDFKKIQEEIEQSLNEVTKIEKEKIIQELESARKEVAEEMSKTNWNKIQKEIEESTKSQTKELKVALEKATQEMAKARVQMDVEKLNMKETLEKARTGIDKAKEELKGYQEMIYDMEAAGLLNTKEDYTIEYNNGDLFINGKKQSPETANKYKKYFGKTKVTINKEDGRFNFHND